MLIERERRAEAVLTHHLEADGVSETHAPISESPQPAIDRRALELSVDEDDRVRWILMQAVEKAKPLGWIAISAEEDLHLGHHEIGRDDGLSRFEPTDVGRTGRVVFRFLGAERGEPA